MNQSPFKETSENFKSSFYNFFVRHDNYLNVAFFACFIPLPLIGIGSLIISIIGFVFQRQNRFQVDESKYLLTILFLSIIHITVTSLIYFVFSLKVIDLIKEFYFGMTNFFYSLFRDVSPFI